jgi:hypothetical protein
VKGPQANGKPEERRRIKRREQSLSTNAMSLYLKTYTCGKKIETFKQNALSLPTAERTSAHCHRYPGPRIFICDVPQEFFVGWSDLPHGATKL